MQRPYRRTGNIYREADGVRGQEIVEETRTRKREKQQKKCKIDNVSEENVAQDETKDKEKETKSAKKW